LFTWNWFGDFDVSGFIKASNQVGGVEKKFSNLHCTISYQLPSDQLSMLPFDRPGPAILTVKTLQIKKNFSAVFFRWKQ
jgi:hypothetical protein